MMAKMIVTVVPVTDSDFTELPRPTGSELPRQPRPVDPDGRGGQPAGSAGAQSVNDQDRSRYRDGLSGLQVGGR
jgi:hypothetical protein